MVLRADIRPSVSDGLTIKVDDLETRLQAGEAWTDLDLVFSTQIGTELDAANVRRRFGRLCARQA